MFSCRDQSNVIFTLTRKRFNVANINDKSNDIKQVLGKIYIMIHIFSRVVQHTFFDH